LLSEVVIAMSISSCIISRYADMCRFRLEMLGFSNGFEHSKWKSLFEAGVYRGSSEPVQPLAWKMDTITTMMTI